MSPLCQNGLHELDPDHPWSGPDGRKCRACHLERKRRYNHSEKGKAASARRVFFSVGGIRWSKAVDNPDEVRARIASFRVGQRAEYREESARLDEEAAA
jgi:hypothetical protein